MHVLVTGQQVDGDPINAAVWNIEHSQPETLKQALPDDSHSRIGRRVGQLSRVGPCILDKCIHRFPGILR